MFRGMFTLRKPLSDEARLLALRFAMIDCLKSETINRSDIAEVIAGAEQDFWLVHGRGGV